MSNARVLQDAYAATGYRLAPDSPAALRSGGGGRERRRGLEQAAGQRAKHLVKACPGIRVWKCRVWGSGLEHSCCSMFYAQVAVELVQATLVPGLLRLLVPGLRDTAVSSCSAASCIIMLSCKPILALLTSNLIHKQPCSQATLLPGLLRLPVPGSYCTAVSS